MAKRHVEEYYNKVASQYKEMSDNIKELEERLSDNMSSYDVIENMKKIVEPVKDNYMTLSWIMFLLNMPNNKSKAERYRKQGMSVLKKANPELENAPKDIINRNENSINELQQLI